MTAVPFKIAPIPEAMTATPDVPCHTHGCPSSAVIDTMRDASNTSLSDCYTIYSDSDSSYNVSCISCNDGYTSHHDSCACHHDCRGSSFASITTPLATSKASRATMTAKRPTCRYTSFNHSFTIFNPGESWLSPRLRQLQRLFPPTTATAAAVPATIQATTGRCCSSKDSGIPATIPAIPGNTIATPAASLANLVILAALPATMTVSRGTHTAVPATIPVTPGYTTGTQPTMTSATATMNFTLAT
jgi:hypothetical protein